jgi:hypothetical protein
VVRKPEGEPSPSLSDAPPPCHAHTLAICRVADRWASTSLNAGLGLVLAECPGGLYVPGLLISFDFVQRTLSGKRIPATPPTGPHLQHGDTYLQCSSPAERVPCLTSLAWSVCPGVPMCRSRAVQKPQFQCSVEKCCQLSCFVICDYWWFGLYEMKCCCPTLELSCFFGLYTLLCCKFICKIVCKG